MNLQQVLLLVGAGIFLIILLDALRRRFLNKKLTSQVHQQEDLDLEELARQAEIARELPSLKKDLDPLFDDLEVFDDDPIPLLNNQQELKLNPVNKAAAQEIIAAKYPQAEKQIEEESVNNLEEAISTKDAIKTSSSTKEQLSFNLPEEKALPAQTLATENLAWEKMRRKFELDPSFAEASRVSMQAQQKELSLLQDIKTKEALRYGAVKKQSFDQESDLADLELPQNLLKSASKPTAKTSKNAAPTAKQAEHLTTSLAKAPNMQALEEQEEALETKATQLLFTEQEVKQKLLASLEATTWGQAAEFLTLNLQAHPSQPFYFSQLADFAKEAELHLSDEGYYHHLEEIAGQKFIGFSVINMLKPGNFLNPSNNPEANTLGLVLLTTLPNTPDPSSMFERMLAIAKVIARNWGAELQDEHSSDLTQQTVAHYKQKIKDFEFQAKINAIKASRKSE